VLANDTDLDGHRDLDICRFSPEPAQGITVQREYVEGPGVLEIEVEPGTSGDFTFEYQACDYSYIVSATLTVTVQPVAATTVTRDPEHPRKLLLTNPDQHEVAVFWFPVRSEVPAGFVELSAGESAAVSAGVHGRIEWFAGFSDGDIMVYTGYGRLGGPTSQRATRTAAPVASEPVDPTTVSPPVTGDEEVTRWAGSMGYVDVLANDSDPQGQPLDVCRIAPSGRDVSGFVEEWNGRFRLDTRENRSGTYTVTYYACNQSRLAPGTVTVHLRRATPVEIATTSRAGVLRIANRNPDQVTVRFLDDFHPEHTRTVRVPADSVRRVHVDPTLTRWHASIGDLHGYAGDGIVGST
jgi:hypothetical protein